MKGVNSKDLDSKLELMKAEDIVFKALAESQADYTSVENTIKEVDGKKEYNSKKTAKKSGRRIDVL